MYTKRINTIMVESKRALGQAQERKCQKDIMTTVGHGSEKSFDSLEKKDETAEAMHLKLLAEPRVR